MKSRCLRSALSATSSTWSTTTATARATTPPRASSVGSATGRTLPTDRSSFPRSSSSSLPSPWASSSGRAENTTTSVSQILDIPVSTSFYESHSCTINITIDFEAFVHIQKLDCEFCTCSSVSFAKNLNGKNTTKTRQHG